jgi:hypothetical protein
MEDRRRVKRRELSAYVLYVSVGAEPRIISEVPARMIRIVVNYDLIARPVPVSNDGIVVGKTLQ